MCSRSRVVLRLLSLSVAPPDVVEVFFSRFRPRVAWFSVGRATSPGNNAS